MCGERSAPLRDGFSATKAWSSSNRCRGRTGVRSARETFVLADTSTCAMRALAEDLTEVLDATEPSHICELTASSRGVGS